MGLFSKQMWRFLRGFCASETQFASLKFDLCEIQLTTRPDHLLLFLKMADLRSFVRGVYWTPELVRWEGKAGGKLAQWRRR